MIKVVIVIVYVSKILLISSHSDNDSGRDTDNKGNGCDNKGSDSNSLYLQYTFNFFLYSLVFSFNFFQTMIPYLSFKSFHQL